MPRLARLDAPGVLYHVMGRGIERRKAVAKARRAMSWIGVRELGYSGAEVARYLGVTNSCVTRLILSGKEQDIEDINLEF
jgi:hypothetical protein